MEGLNVKRGWDVIRDRSDYVVVGYGEGGVYDDWGEDVIVYVGVEMLEEVCVGEWGIGVEEDEGNVGGRGEDIGGWEWVLGEGWGFWDRMKGKE